MKITYERFCFPVTFRCNLNCKLCAEHSPYVKRPYHPSLEKLMEQLEKLFELVERIEKFDITGGEPFLRKDLPDILDYLYSNYRDKIGTVRVTTNGTLVPTMDFVNVAIKWKENIDIIVDNYAVSDKSEQAYHVLNDAGIPCELRDYSDKLHCDGWVDYGDISIKHTRKEAKRLFQKCMVPRLGFFTCMVNGLLFPCAKARILYENIIGKAQTVHVDLFDPMLTEHGKKARMKTLMGNEVVDVCQYCNGLCEDSSRFPPAEQLTVTREAARKKMKHEDWCLKYGKVLIYTQTFNNEKTIARTIESVLNQSNQDFTYFICNNASTDRTGEIIRKYAEKDNRIVYFECDRNDVLGTQIIPYAIFDFVPQYLDCYFTILDGDDTIELDFIENVLEMVYVDKPDMIVSSVNRVDAKTGGIISQRKVEKNVIVSGKQKTDNFMQLRPLVLSQWGKVYRCYAYVRAKDIIVSKNISHMPKWFHQYDTLGALNAFLYFEKCGFIGKPIYNYYIYSDSTYSKYTPERVKNDVLMFNVYNEVLDQYPPVAPINRDYCYAIYLSLLTETLDSILSSAVVADEQKLLDILDILHMDVTRNLFCGTFDPIFRNLSNRGAFIKQIDEYLEKLPMTVIGTDLYHDTMVELEKISHFLKEE